MSEALPSPPVKQEDANNAGFSLKVKPGYTLQSPHSVLASRQAPPVAPPSTNRNDNSSAPPRADNPDWGGNGKRKEKGNKRKRGQNKNTARPKDEREDPTGKVCLAIVKGNECPYGDKCKYPHDMKAFMASSKRPKDIGAECVIFKKHGYCPYGVNCRWGLSHVCSKTGENLRLEKDGTVDLANNKKKVPSVDDATSSRNTTSDDGVGQLPVTNVIPGNVLYQIRKGTFPFICPRKQTGDDKNNKKKGKNSRRDDETTSNVVPAVVDLSALPSKEVKMIDFDNKVYVAPLTTVGNLPFRRCMKRFGADITCGEMAMCANLLQGQTSEWALIKRHREEDVFGVQLAGGFPDQLTRVGEILERECSVDFVDINCGCPLDLVCDKGAGASLMNAKRRLEGIVEGMSKVMSVPVTIKMRTGWEEKKPFAKDLVSSIFKWKMPNIAAIMVHGRSRLQRYSKLANWDYIAEVGQIGILNRRSVLRYNEEIDDGKNPLYAPPVIGNGDIFSYVDFEERKREGISNTAMLARGALIKPWLPTEIKEQRHWDISASERLDHLKQFVNFGLEHWGSDQRGLNITRRFLLEWLSFLYRYVPVGLLEAQCIPQRLNQRPPQNLCGRSDLETLMMSDNCKDWIKISEILLGKVPEGFAFEPKHKANSYSN